jgi:meiotically up-regulated gene 157 (Mug157) protein
MKIQTLLLSLVLSSSAMATDIQEQVPVSIQTPDTFYHRLPVEKRCFTSKAVEKQIKQMQKTLMSVSPKLWQMFQNSFPNTLDTTVFPDGDKTFVITGDINAMWLRDSGAQVWTYISYIQDDPELAKLIRGVILQQFEFICLDAYANAFMDDPNEESH